MSADSKWYLVTYDVRDDKRLRKVAKHLKGYGTRLQYSVFRCWLSHTDTQRLCWELTSLLDPADDILFIPLCDSCVRGMQVTHSTLKRPGWPEKPRNHIVV